MYQYNLHPLLLARDEETFDNENQMTITQLEFHLCHHPSPWRSFEMKNSSSSFPHQPSGARPLSPMTFDPCPCPLCHPRDRVCPPRPPPWWFNSNRFSQNYSNSNLFLSLGIILSFVAQSPQFFSQSILPFWVLVGFFFLFFSSPYVFSLLSSLVFGDNNPCASSYCFNITLLNYQCSKYCSILSFYTLGKD